MGLASGLTSEKRCQLQKDGFRKQSVSQKFKVLDAMSKETPETYFMGFKKYE